MGVRDTGELTERMSEGERYITREKDKFKRVKWKKERVYTEKEYIFVFIYMCMYVFVCAREKWRAVV